MSTNAGIRDYRGPNGIWTEAVQAGVIAGEPGEAKNRLVESPWDEAMYQMLPAAEPTFAHRAVTMLATAPATPGGEPLVKHVISQNEDGLHLRSGLSPGRLSELHGNAFIEVCGRLASDSDSDLGSSDDSSDDEDDDAAAAIDAAAKAEARGNRSPGCGAAIVRDFVTYYGETYRRSNAAGRHVTGRACPNCRPDGAPPPASGPAKGAGWLLDTTVDFGEAPGGFPWGTNEVHNVAAAKHHMQRADLVLVLGSSLSILANYFRPWYKHSKWAKAPPAGLRLGPDGETAARGGDDDPPGKRKSKGVPPVCKLAIVTMGDALDQELAALKIEADVDTVMKELLRLLGLATPQPYRADADGLWSRVLPAKPDEPRAPWAVGGRAVPGADLGADGDGGGAGDWSDQGEQGRGGG